MYKKLIICKKNVQSMEAGLFASKTKIDIFIIFSPDISSGPDEANSMKETFQKDWFFFLGIAGKTKMLKFKPKLFSNNVLYLFLPCLSWFFGLLPTNFGNAAHPLLKTFSLTFRVSNYFIKWCRKTQANSLIFS